MPTDLAALVPASALMSSLCGASAPAAGSAGKGTYPMQVSVTIASGHDYMAGQAIILHYEMANVTGSHLVITPLDINSDQWYSLTVTDASGNVVKPLPERLPLRKRGAFSVPTYMFYSSSTREGDIVLNRNYGIAAPGPYKVTVHTHLAYVGCRGSNTLRSQLHA